MGRQRAWHWVSTPAQPSAGRWLVSGPEVSWRDPRKRRILLGAEECTVLTHPGRWVSCSLQEHLPRGLRLRGRERSDARPRVLGRVNVQ